MAFYHRRLHDAKRNGIRRGATMRVLFIRLARATPRLIKRRVTCGMSCGGGSEPSLRTARHKQLFSASWGRSSSREGLASCSSDIDVCVRKRRAGVNQHRNEIMPSWPLKIKFKALYVENVGESGGVFRCNLKIISGRPAGGDSSAEASGNVEAESRNNHGMPNRSPSLSSRRGLDPSIAGSRQIGMPIAPGADDIIEGQEKRIARREEARKITYHRA